MAMKGADEATKFLGGKLVDPLDIIDANATRFVHFQSTKMVGDEMAMKGADDVTWTKFVG